MTTDFVRELTSFDKLNLAACAMRRAQDPRCGIDRYEQEFQTAMVWAREASRVWHPVAPLI